MRFERVLLTVDTFHLSWKFALRSSFLPNHYLLLPVMYRLVVLHMPFCGLHVVLQNSYVPLFCLNSLLDGDPHIV